MSSYGAPLLDASTTQQIEQFAMLVSEGDRSFQFWEVLFSDGYGNLLRLHLDDETGLPLAMFYASAEETKAIADWCVLSLMALGEYCGLSAVEAQSTSAGDILPQIPVYYIPATDGITIATVKVQAGSGWFAIGDRIG